MYSALRHKPSKRNIALSNQQLLRDNRNHRMVSRPGELPFANYRKIDNAYLSAAATAAQTKVRFDLQQKATDDRWLFALLFVVFFDFLFFLLSLFFLRFFPLGFAGFNDPCNQCNHGCCG